MLVMLQRTLKLRASDGTAHNITENVVVQQFEAVPGNKQVTRPMPLPLVGEKVKPTSLGDFVNCQYQYIVKCDVNYGADIDLVMPVTIYAPRQLSVLSLFLPPCLVILTLCALVVCSAQNLPLCNNQHNSAHHRRVDAGWDSLFWNSTCLFLYQL